MSWFALDFCEMSSTSIGRMHEPEFDMGLIMIPSMSYWHYTCHAILPRIHLHICDSISIVVAAGFFSLLLLLCPLQMPQVPCVSICFVGTNSHIVSRTVVASPAIVEIDSLWHEWHQNELNQLLCKCSWINGLRKILKMECSGREFIQACPFALILFTILQTWDTFPLLSINIIWLI